MGWVTWKLYRLDLAILMVIQCIYASDIKCKGSHKEVTFPKLVNKNSFNGLPVHEDDPLQLHFKWRGELLCAELYNHVITIPYGIAEWETGENITEGQLLGTGQTFYQGHIRGKKFSIVALSISSTGLSGYLQVDREGLYIENIGNGTRRGSLGPHVIRSCGRVVTPRHDGPASSNRGDTYIPSRRQKRAAPSRYLEVLVVADSTVTDVVGQSNVQTYLMTIMNIVNTIYHDDSLGTEIDVLTVKIKFLDKQAEKRIIHTYDPKRTVDDFCQWTSYGGGSNHDVAVLLTRHAFVPAGYAPITGMCVPMRNCALVKDDGFTSAFVVAHEIAHIFGLMHDGAGNNCYGQQYHSSIMATQVQSSFTNYWWSGCSKARMAEVIGRLSCLNNNPRELIPDRLIKPVGVSWSLEQQCNFEFGGNAKYCPFFGSRSPCSQLWCSDNSGVYTCKSKHVAPLDGTQCGPTPKWYCYQGDCSYHGNESPVNGAWGSWGSWSDCSSNCGIGFKRRSRNCDNPNRFGQKIPATPFGRPCKYEGSNMQPKYNGEDCDGLSDNTDTCKAKNCTEFIDMRAYQCSNMDVAVVSGVTHRWLPYQAVNQDDLCKLTCISESTNEVITFNTFADNATPCSYERSDGICINGKCMNVGCDGIKGSSKKEDRCGVCNGNGKSCKTVTGVYNKTFEYSAAGLHYEKVIKLPKGSRDIVVKERSNSPHFLSVQDLVYYKQVLNDKGKLGRSKNFVLEGAWFKYENHGGRENLKSTGPLYKPVNVMVYPKDWKKPADIEYSYIVDNNDFTYEQDRYQWKFDSWSPCSVTCGKGTQEIVHVCYDKLTEEIVDSKKCEYTGKPDTDSSECERVDCNSILYGWRMLRNFTECSATCGQDGVRHRRYDCALVSKNRGVDDKFCEHIPEPIFPEACNRFACGLPTFSWEVTSTWTECTETCGTTGTQHQMFNCVRDQDGKIEKVPDTFCADIKSPKELRACSRIKCIDYRWVLSEDWFRCNETCGITGTQSKKPTCQKFQDGKFDKDVGIWYCAKQKKPSESRECNRRECYTYQWDVTEDWEDCSHQCGDKGTRIKITVCKNVTYDNRERMVGESYCAKLDRPHADREECNRIQCESFEWSIVEDWAPRCPRTCADKRSEKQYRVVICNQRFHTGQIEQTDKEFCDQDAKPDIERNCPKLNCPLFEWGTTGEWSECSATCGPTAIQTEIVRCHKVQDNGSKIAVDDGNCISTKPTDITRPCDLNECTVKRYKSTPVYRQDPDAPWSDCSVTCGSGVQHQMLKCTQPYTNGDVELVPEINCIEAGQELPGRTCEMGRCGFLEWQAGPWSMCSASCGVGKQKRVVTCGRPEDRADIDRCPGKSPSEYRSCEVKPCGGCVDRAPFCGRANARLCSNAAYVRVCCQSCEQQKSRARLRSVRYSRHLRNLRRLFYNRRRRNRQ